MSSGAPPESLVCAESKYQLRVQDNRAQAEGGVIWFRGNVFPPEREGKGLFGSIIWAEQSSFVRLPFIPSSKVGVYMRGVNV